jgi:hypothetical protein
MNRNPFIFQFIIILLFFNNSLAAIVNFYDEKLDLIDKKEFILGEVIDFSSYQLGGVVKWYSVDNATAVSEYKIIKDMNLYTTPLVKEISTVEELNSIRNFLDRRYILTQDIQLTEEWKPIGDGENPFTGIFNGNGYKISGLWINLPDVENVGFFGKIDNSIIKNLGIITNGSKGGVLGLRAIGGIVGNGYSESSEIKNTYFNGKVEGYEFVGGIAGIAPNLIENSYSIGKVIGVENVGGISGVIGVKIRKSYSMAEINGINRVGGITGLFGGGSIVEGSYFKGKVIGVNYVGGIAGKSGYFSEAYKCNYNMGIMESYSDGMIRGVFYVGGIAGYIIDAIVMNSYSSSYVSGKHSVGGVIGSNDGGVINTYFVGKVLGEGKYTGGIVGHNGGLLENSYFAGIVEGKEYTGGIAGYAYPGGIRGTLSASSSINGKINTDRLVARISGETDEINFALSAINKDFTNFSEGNTHTGTSKTSGELNKQSTYSAPPPNGLGWGFGNDVDNPWTMEGSSGYPILYWQLDKIEPPNRKVYCYE